MSIERMPRLKRSSVGVLRLHHWPLRCVQAQIKYSFLQTAAVYLMGMIGTIHRFNHLHYHTFSKQYFNSYRMKLLCIAESIHQFQLKCSFQSNSGLLHITLGSS